MNLLVFLSDRCNMSCDYCFLSLNNEPTTILSEAHGVRAVEAHAARVGAGARVTLLGGEPLLHPQSALSLARRARRAGARVSLVTNATKASRPVVDELLALGVEIVASVDGAPSSHDRHRRTLGGAPSHAVVQNCLSRLPVAKLRANMVVTPENVGSFLSNVEWLRRFGFVRLSFHLDIASAWDENALGRLSTVMQGFKRYAAALEAAAPGAFALWHLESFRAASAGAPRDCGDLILGADGRYYADDAWLSKSYGHALDAAVGDTVVGLDEAKLGRLRSEVDKSLAEVLAGDAQYTWPRAVWLLAQMRGRDPIAAVRSYRRADILVGDVLSTLSPKGRVSHA
jgi:hypothetical protein